MEQSIIEAKQVAKKYDIAHMRGGYIAFRDVLANALRSPAAFLTRKAKQAVGLEKKEEFWALKDVNFSIKKGETVGIIGRNGAGKSTLLKIISQITPPTEGELTIRGRVGSLLEVGTGFHPELTGRENVFLNGAILGMKRREIATKFDEIVAFAGIEKFLDTPVKFYSSGMYVRLAFSVAAHMEPDILLVDEVLAVGDAEFQKKCLDKMDEITQKEGRTIVFVSHNMAAIKTLCDTCIYLDRGRVKMIGPTDQVLAAYTESGVRDATQKLGDRVDRKGDGRLRATEITCEDENGISASSIACGTDMTIIVRYNLKDAATKKIVLALGIDNVFSNRVALISNSTIRKDLAVKLGQGEIRVKLPKVQFNTGDYQLTLFIEDEAGKILDWVQNAARFSITPGAYYESGNMPKQGDVLLKYTMVSK